MPKQAQAKGGGAAEGKGQRGNGGPLHASGLESERQVREVTTLPSNKHESGFAGIKPNTWRYIYRIMGQVCPKRGVEGRRAFCGWFILWLVAGTSEWSQTYNCRLANLSMVGSGPLENTRDQSRNDHESPSLPWVMMPLLEISGAAEGSATLNKTQTVPRQSESGAAV